ncbi:MAG: SlyX family protein [Pseudomonadota bacterium]
MQEGPMPDDINARLQNIEEKFAHQERMVDALNEVVIEQQAQLVALEEQLCHFKALVETMHDQTPGGEDPPPPHY